MDKVNGKVVVVGVDFHQSGDEAIVAALRMLGEGSARKVHVLHVLDPRDIVDDPESPVMQTESEVLEHAPGVLRERVRELSNLHGLTFGTGQVIAHARLGAAVATLLQMTVDYDADLLIVGTHGRRGIDRLVLGSVAENLVRKAHCPVLVARPKDYAGCEKTRLPDPPFNAEEKAFHDRGREHTGEFVQSTELDSWRPSHSPPTGFRIV